MHVFKALFECLYLKWWQRPDMTFAVDFDVKHQFKQFLRLGHEFKFTNSPFPLNQAHLSLCDRKCVQSIFDPVVRPFPDYSTSPLENVRHNFV